MADTSMPATFGPPPRKRDAPLIIGVAAFLCGMGVIGCGLQAPEAEFAKGSALMPSLSSIGHDAPLAPSDADAMHTVRVRHAEQQAGPVAPALHRQNGRRLSGNVEGLIRAEINAATARWLAAWSRIRVTDAGTAPAYLAMSSGANRSAAWFRAITAWEVTSGYGSLESRRFGEQSPAHDLENDDAANESIRRERRASERNAQHSVLALSSAWSRERGPDGVRGSVLQLLSTIGNGKGAK